MPEYSDMVDAFTVDAALEDTDRVVLKGNKTATIATLAADSAFDGQYAPLGFLGEQLDAGITTMPRQAATAAVTTFSQSLFVSYFTAPKNMTVASLGYVQGTTASSDITTHRLGMYTVSGAGALTLVASTPNDTNLGTTQNTRYTKALSSPYAIIRGTRYAVGKLIVATTAGNAAGVNVATTGMATSNNLDPKVCAGVTSQTDLAAGPTNVTAFASSLYFELLT